MNSRMNRRTSKRGEEGSSSSHHRRTIPVAADDEAPENDKKKRRRRSPLATLRLYTSRASAWRLPHLLMVSLAGLLLFGVSYSRLSSRRRLVRLFTRTIGGSYSFGGELPILLTNRQVKGRFHSIPESPPLLVPIEPDYGELEICTLKYAASPSYFRRVISRRDHARYNRERSEFLDDIDERHMKDKYFHSDELDYPRTCERTNWGWRPYPNCNSFHEFSLNPMDNLDVNIKYLSHGYYRDTWLWNPLADGASENYVLKTLRLNEDHDMDYYTIRKIEVEAIVLERLTASPRIVDQYGYCSTSIRAETMPGEITERIVPGDTHADDRGRIKQRDLDKLQIHGVHPLNNFTAVEKLDLALIMAESLADIHGFEGGVIVHGDTHPDQWLVGKDGKLKLNDFNNGILLLFDRKKNDYCYYQTSFGGTYKAPEEFTYGDANEKVDTWAMGHGIYGLLTGLYPYYDEFDHAAVRKMVKKGKKPYVDQRYRTRSFIERRLIDIMEQCWEFDVEKRLEIFEVVKHLRETKRMYDNGEGD